MKLCASVLLSSLCLFAAAPAGATGSHQFGMEVGASVPAGSFGDAAVTGYNLGAQYQFMKDRFGMGAEVKYHAWGASDEMNMTAGPASEYRFAAWQYDVYGIMAKPMPAARPYVKLGVGWYAPKMTLEAPGGDVDESDTNFGMLVGGGVDFSTSGPMTFGMGATYHRIKDSESDFVSLTARVMWPLGRMQTP